VKRGSCLLALVLMLLQPAVTALPAWAQAGNGGVVSVPSIIQIPTPEGPVPATTAIRPPKQSNGPPLYGQSQPIIGPPTPLPQSAVGPPNPCPNGYIQSPVAILPHTLICVVAQQQAATRAANPAIQNLQDYALGPGAQPLASSSLPPTLEGARINECAELPGYYACGRGATECCGPNQDNYCFPGAYACSEYGGMGSGPKQACCMIR